MESKTQRSVVRRDTGALNAMPGALNYQTSSRELETQAPTPTEQERGSVVETSAQRQCLCPEPLRQSLASPEAHPGAIWKDRGGGDRAVVGPGSAAPRSQQALTTRV